MPIPRGYRIAATRKNPPAAAPAMSASGRKSVSSAAIAITAASAAGPVIRFGMIRSSRSISVIGTSAVTSSRPRTMRTASSWLATTAM
jgi:hypothetical protein